MIEIHCPDHGVIPRGSSNPPNENGHYRCHVEDCDQLGRAYKLIDAHPASGQTVSRVPMKNLYLKATAELMETRRQEELLLDEMDALWAAMTPQDRQEIQEPPN